MDKNKYFLAYLRRIHCRGTGLVMNPYISSRIKMTVTIYTRYIEYGSKVMAEKRKNKLHKYIYFSLELSFVVLS